MTTAPVAARYVRAGQNLPGNVPVYLIHGFRWPRKAVRIHVILHNLEDAAPDYTMAMTSNEAIIGSLRRLYPDMLADLPHLRMVEEYDPADESAVSNIQEFAYVADKVVRHGPGIDLKHVQDEGIPAAQWGAMADLREEIAKGEQLGWWIVYNADPERAIIDSEDDLSDVEVSLMSIAVDRAYFAGWQQRQASCGQEMVQEGSHRVEHEPDWRSMNHTICSSQ